MSRTGSYGQSFAMKHLEAGRPEQALAEADRAVAQDPADPEPVLDRAQVYAQLGRHADAVADVERCLELDAVARVIDDALLDDTLFSTLVSWGREVAPTDPEAAVRIIERYRAILPDGGHAEEVAVWARRFRGHRETWAKARPDDP